MVMNNKHSDKNFVYHCFQVSELRIMLLTAHIHLFFSSALSADNSSLHQWRTELHYQSVTQVIIFTVQILWVWVWVPLRV